MTQIDLKSEKKLEVKTWFLLKEKNFWETSFCARMIIAAKIDIKFKYDSL